MQVDGSAVRNGDLDEVATQISSFVAGVEHVGIVERLVHIPHHV